MKQISEGCPEALRFLISRKNILDEAKRNQEMDLSEEERAKGAQIGRVELRVAGQMKRIPYKLIADPDDASLVVIAQRDRDRGDLEPARRRGAKRHVEKLSLIHISEPTRPL